MTPDRTIPSPIGSADLDVSPPARAGGQLYETLPILASGFLATIRSLA